MDYLIASGDTLSGIARANKLGIQDILKLNPQITDPNRISAGQSIKLPGASTPITTAQPTTSAINTPVPNFQGTGATVTSDMVGAPITRNDLRARRQELEKIATQRQTAEQEQQALFNKLAQLQQASEREQQLSQNVARSTAEEAKILRDLTLERRNIERNQEGRLQSGVNIASQLAETSAGQQREDLLYKRLVDSAELQALSGIRQADIDATKTSIAAREQLIDRALGIEQNLTGLNEQDRKNTRQTLLDIVDFSQGSTFDELSPAEQEAIANTAQLVGVPLSSVQQAMVRNKTALNDERRKIDASINKSTSETLTPYQQFTATQSIAKDTQARTAQAREMVRQADLIKQSYANIEAGGDKSLNTQAIVTAFNKILDPTSVVRESEYDRTAEGQALITRLSAKVQNITEGGAGVSKETLKEATKIADTYLANAQKSILAQNQRARDIAVQFGLNPDFVTTGDAQTPPANQPATPPTTVISTGKVGDITYTVKKK